MSRLPVTGSDEGVWGDILNDFLLVEHNASGVLKDVVRTTDSRLTDTRTPTDSSVTDAKISFTLSQSKITNLTTDLAAKATDSSVVHLSGTESIAGSKTFTTDQNIDANLRIKGPIPYIDVRAYGAVGNGSTDDTAAIQSAFNAAAINGVVIYFPHTSNGYLISSPINVYGSSATSPKIIKVVGDGPEGFSILKASPSLTGPVLNVAPQANYNGAFAQRVGYEIRNLYIDLTTAPNADGIYLDNVQSYAIENVKVRGGLTGIKFAYASIGTYRDVKCYNQTDAGIKAIDSYSYTTTLSGAIASTNSTGTINVSNASGLPTGGGYIYIDSEMLKYSSISGNTLTLSVRASNGTTGATHSDGATVTWAVPAGSSHRFFNCVVYLTSGASSNMNSGVDIRGAYDIWMAECTVLRSAGNAYTMKYGLKLTALGTGFFGGLMMVNTAFDGITEGIVNGSGAALYLSNYQKAQVTNSWFSCYDASSVPVPVQASIYIYGASDYVFSNNWISGSGVQLRGSPKNLLFTNNNFPTGAQQFDVLNTEAPTRLQIIGNGGGSGVSTVPLTNDTTTLGAAMSSLVLPSTSIDSSAPGLQIGDGVAGMAKIGSATISKSSGQPLGIATSGLSTTLSGTGVTWIANSTSASATFLGKFQKAGVDKLTIDVSGNVVATGSVTGTDGIITKTKSGAPTDGDFVTAPSDGAMAVNTSNNSLYIRSSGTWTQLTSAGSLSAHETTHLPGGTDAIDWSGTIHASGTAASRPAAGSTNSGTLYFATDTGALWRSTGSAWQLLNYDNQYLFNGGHSYREPFPRHVGSTTLATLTSGIMYLVAIPLYAGDVVTNITFVASTVALTMGNNNDGHLWFALYDSALGFLAQTSDQGAAATWSASSVKTLALTGAQTISTSGIYYAAVMVNAGTGSNTPTPNTLRGIGFGSTGFSTSTGWPTGMKTLSAQNGSGLTTTAPAGTIVLTNNSNAPYCVLS